MQLLGDYRIIKSNLRHANDGNKNNNNSLKNEDENEMKQMKPFSTQDHFANITTLELLIQFNRHLSPTTETTLKQSSEPSV